MGSRRNNPCEALGAWAVLRAQLCLLCSPCDMTRVWWCSGGDPEDAPCTFLQHLVYWQQVRVCSLSASGCEATAYFLDASRPFSTAPRRDWATPPGKSSDVSGHQNPGGLVKTWAAKSAGLGWGQRCALLRVSQADASHPWGIIHFEHLRPMASSSGFFKVLGDCGDPVLSTEW